MANIPMFFYYDTFFIQIKAGTEEGCVSLFEIHENKLEFVKLFDKQEGNVGIILTALHALKLFACVFQDEYFLFPGTALVISLLLGLQMLSECGMLKQVMQ